MRAIISNNCWGSGYYQERQLQYNTPTVGLFFFPDDYLKFLSKFRDFIPRPIRFTKCPRRGKVYYPVGVIGDDVEIHFLHYEDESQAESKWRRRLSRLPENDCDLCIKICDRDGFSEKHLSEFHRLSFQTKVAFLTRAKYDVKNYPWAVEVDNGENTTVPDGVTLYEITKKSEKFSIGAWVNGSTDLELNPVPTASRFTFQQDTKENKSKIEIDFETRETR